MDEKKIREWVAEVLMLRSADDFKLEEEALLRAGAVGNVQIRSGDVRMRVAELRAMAPSLLVASDMETGSTFATDGMSLPPQMALGATDSEDLAFAWGRAVGWEGRRLGIDVAFGPVLDVNTNPDNPIINVRSFGEDPTAVGRLGAALVRGFAAAGLHGCGKHWPGSGDLAVDCHIALGHSTADEHRLRSVEWQPFRAAIAAGLDGIMTGHVMVSAIDPQKCATVSAALVSPLRTELKLRGLIYTDSLGMEGLRTTLDSTEAAWQAIAAGHDLVPIDYKRPPSESVEAVVGAALDGRLPTARLREAAEAVRRFKASFATRSPLPPSAEIRNELQKVGRQVAAAAVTGWNYAAQKPDWGSRPLLILCDDLSLVGKDAADELGRELKSRHPVVSQVLDNLPTEVLVLNENPSPEEIAEAIRRAEEASAVLGISIARISCYKGTGMRLPDTQRTIWRELRRLGRLPAMILLGSPYALSDFPSDIPIILGYGDDAFTVDATLRTLLTGSPCPGRLPVTVGKC